MLTLKDIDLFSSFLDFPEVLEDFDFSFSEVLFEDILFSEEDLETSATKSTSQMLFVGTFKNYDLLLTLLGDSSGDKLGEESSADQTGLSSTAKLIYFLT